jgi:tRNA ligase
LHLHGINESTKAFKTLPQADVDAFADEWGFIKTLSITFQNISEVKTFTDDVGKTGKWNGDAVEGFVVRTHVAELSANAWATGTSPYPPGSTFFFKIKFDEPYMMYRDWRELTKTLLSTKGPLSHAKLSKMRMKRPETRLYVKWVTEQIQKDRKQFDQYTKGRGIVSARERFLKWLEGEKGLGELNAAMENTRIEDAVEDQGGEIFGKTIIVPIAIPGCGAFSFDLKTKKNPTQLCWYHEYRQVKLLCLSR